VIAAFALLAALAAEPSAAAPTATDLKAPVKEPVWLAAPSESMMLNCTTGYLRDPAFTGESIMLGCVVQTDGTLGQCVVRETKRAQSAGVEDVAVCAAGGFRIGPIDKAGKPTAGRPILIPMGIATVGGEPEKPSAPAEAPVKTGKP